MNPPLIRASGGVRPSRHPAAWAFGVLLALLGAARLTLVWPWAVPACVFKRLTGIPCPFCGGTRCLQALASLDLGAAARWNPLVFAGCLGVVLWFCLSLAGQVSGRGGPKVRRLSPALSGAVLAGLVVANWVYLWARLP